MSAGFISQLENGKCGVSVGALKRISAAVGISAADLLADDAPVARPVLRAISIASETHVLGPRDSVEYLSSVLHRAVNIGATMAQALWITSHFPPPIDTNPLSALPAHQTKE